MKFKEYINEDYDWLSKPKANFVKKIEKEGNYIIKTKPITNTIMIYKENKRTKKPTKGLVIYPDGSAVDMTVDLSVAKTVKSVKDWEKILK